MDEPAPQTPSQQPTRSAIASGIAIINYGLLAAAMIAALMFLKIIVISAAIGLGIGVLLAPPLRHFQARFKLPRGVGAVVVVLITIGVIGGVGYGIYVIAESQVMSLVERMPQIVEKLQGIANRLLERYPWLDAGSSSFNVSDTARAVGGKLFKGAWSSVSVFGALIFAFIIGLYTAVDAENYYRGMLNAFAPRHRDTAADFLKQSALTIRNWFHAQLIDMAIIGSLTAIGLWLVGVDYWLLFGLLTGLLGIIPYAGIAIVVTFAGLVTLASDPGRLPWVIAVFVTTQQLEGHVILPLVMSGQAALPAVPLLIFMLVIGSWGGLLGVLIAPPLFAIALLAYRRFYLQRIEATPA
jgi:predicted PurR-regulated permease PerM